MKKFGILIAAILVVGICAFTLFADTALHIPIPQNPIDTYQVTSYKVGPDYVTIEYNLGYDNTGTFVASGKTGSVTVTDQAIQRNNRLLLRFSQFGTLPVAYQTTPGTTLATNFNEHNWGASVTGTEFAEVVLNVLAGL